MDTLSFDGLADCYGETRSFDKGCFDSALQFISSAFPPDSYPVWFEPGIGDGRIAVPLARRGYRVAGVDISGEMLAALKRRLRGEPAAPPVSSARADALRLPFPDGVFDAVVVVHFFYFIRDWKAAVREILRVVRGRGAVILMHTGTGAEIPFLNERYKEICASLGSVIPQIGVNSTREVVEYSQSLGCATEWIRDRWKWIERIPVRKALEYVEHRSYSFTMFPPAEIHRKAIQVLESELRERFKPPDAVVEVPNQIYLVILRRT